MRRRSIVALLIFIPLTIATMLYGVFPESLEWILGYMLALALAFKSAILAFYSASKLKLIAFFKGLTLLQGIFLLLKRWFLDNVFSQWLRRNILHPASAALKEAKEYYLGLDLRAKMRNTLLALFASSFAVWALYSSGYLSHIFLFTELKVIIISLSKTVLLVISKFISLLFNSWLTPIFEVFAFSWLFSWLERTLGPKHPINRLLNHIGYFFGRIFASVILLARRYIDPLLNQRVRKKSKELAKRAQSYIQDRKIAYEMEQFERLERLVTEGQISAYLSFKGMDSLGDKRELYRLINRKNRDGIEIVAFVSRDKKGTLLAKDGQESFNNDVLLLEGLASSQKRGVKRELANNPDYSDFWILNLSLYPATLRSHSGIVPPTPVTPQSLKHISCERLPNYHDGDLYLEYMGRSERFIPIEEENS